MSHPADRLIAAPLLLAAIGCHAETGFSLYLGASATRDSDLKVEQAQSNATFRDVSWDSRDLEAAPYYGLRLTHFFEAAPNWGLALDFTHYKIYADTGRAVPVDGVWKGAPVNESAPLDARVQRFNISHGVNFLSLNGLYRFSLMPAPDYPRGRLRPYMGGGLAYLVLHPENTIDNVSNDEKYQRSGYGYQLLGGVEYSLSRALALFVELKLSRGTAKVDTGAGGRAETRLETGHAVAGVTYTF